MKKKLHSTLANTIASINQTNISDERKILLQSLIDYIQSKQEKKEAINLNFICTHNSRRSQFTQVWAQTAAFYYGINVNCFSGGVEVTACNERTIASLERSGFKVKAKGEVNPRYEVSFSEAESPLILFSKLYDDAVNPTSGFAALMTCDHADENCPYISGTEARIPLLYEDPKAFDDTDLETEKYDERSMQIAIELFYVFSQLN